MTQAEATTTHPSPALHLSLHLTPNGPAYNPEASAAAHAGSGPSHNAYGPAQGLDAACSTGYNAETGGAAYFAAASVPSYAAYGPPHSSGQDAGSNNISAHNSVHSSTYSPAYNVAYGSAHDAAYAAQGSRSSVFSPYTPVYNPAYSPPSYGSSTSTNTFASPTYGASTTYTAPRRQTPVAHPSPWPPCAGTGLGYNRGGACVATIHGELGIVCCFCFRHF